MRGAGQPRLVLWVVLTVVAALAGFALALIAGARVSDPSVQGALVGALAGIAGGVIGAAIGVFGSREVARLTIRDSQEARREARQDAERAKFLRERREAIMEFLQVIQDTTETAWSLLFNRETAMVMALDLGWQVGHALTSLSLHDAVLAAEARELVTAAHSFRDACVGRDPEVRFDAGADADATSNAAAMEELRVRRLRVASLIAQFTLRAAERLGTLGPAES
jgi:hypothetical protein